MPSQRKLNVHLSNRSWNALRVMFDEYTKRMGEGEDSISFEEWIAIRLVRIVEEHDAVVAARTDPKFLARCK